MEDNKLIAEFMGAKPIVLGGSTEYEMYGVLDCIEDGVDEKHYYIDDDMQFHTEWNWLMPVVENILDLSFQDDGDADDFYNVRDCMPDLNHTYKAVVEFIKQYNDGRV